MDFSWLSGRKIKQYQRTWTQYHIEHLKDLTSVTVHALCESPLVLDLHWYEGYKLCTGEGCEMCQIPNAYVRQKGYLPCYWHSRNKCIVMEIPEGCMKELSQIGREWKSIMGVALRFYKARGRANNPMHVAPEQMTVPKEKRPEVFDPRPSILYAYGYPAEVVEQAVAKMPLWVPDLQWQ